MGRRRPVDRRRQGRPAAPTRPAPRGDEHLAAVGQPRGEVERVPGPRGGWRRPPGAPPRATGEPGAAAGTPRPPHRAGHVITSRPPAPRLHRPPSPTTPRRLPAARASPHSNRGRPRPTHSAPSTTTTIPTARYPMSWRRGRSDTRVTVRTPGSRRSTRSSRKRHEGGGIAAIRHTCPMAPTSRSAAPRRRYRSALLAEAHAAGPRSPEPGDSSRHRRPRSAMAAACRGAAREGGTTLGLLPGTDRRARERVGDRRRRHRHGRVCATAWSCAAPTPRSSRSSAAGTRSPRWPWPPSSVGR